MLWDTITRHANVLSGSCVGQGLQADIRAVDWKCQNCFFRDVFWLCSNCTASRLPKSNNTHALMERLVSSSWFFCTKASLPVSFHFSVQSCVGEEQFPSFFCLRNDNISAFEDGRVKADAGCCLSSAPGAALWQHDMVLLKSSALFLFQECPSESHLLRL